MTTTMTEAELERLSLTGTLQGAEDFLKSPDSTQYMLCDILNESLSRAAQEPSPSMTVAGVEKLDSRNNNKAR